MQLQVSRRAERYLSGLDPRTRARFASELRRLAEDPFHPGSKPLEGIPGERSIRVGGWRIVYFVRVDDGIVEVDHIGPRGEVYWRLH